MEKERQDLCSTGMLLVDGNLARVVFAWECWKRNEMRVQARRKLPTLHGLLQVVLHQAWLREAEVGVREKRVTVRVLVLLLLALIRFECRRRLIAPHLESFNLA